MAVTEYNEYGQVVGTKEFASRRDAAYAVGHSVAENGYPFMARYLVVGESALMGSGDDGYEEGHAAGLLAKAEYAAYLASEAKNWDEFKATR